MSKAAFLRHERQIDELTKAARNELESFVTRLDLSKPTEAARAINAFVPHLVATYGEVGASMAADFYDSLRSASARAAGAPAFSAPMAAPVPAAQAAAMSNWAVQVLFEAGEEVGEALLSRLVGGTDRLIRDPVRRTIGEATLLDPLQDVRFARIPHSAHPCQFCTMLASRGAVYYSARTAEAGYHSGCACTAAPIFDEAEARESLDGYDPDYYYARYLEDQRALESRKDLARRRAAVKAKLDDVNHVKAGHAPVLIDEDPFIINVSNRAAHNAVTKMHENAAAGKGAGATVDAVSGEIPDHGFVVAVEGDYERVIDVTDNLEPEVAQYVRDNWEALNGSHRYLGLWQDDGKLYLDVSEVWPDQAHAIHLAQDRSELAIYDLGHGVEIRTPDTAADYLFERGYMPIPTGPEPWDVAMRNTNPYYFPESSMVDKEFPRLSAVAGGPSSNNCQKCATAYELRRRGLDVIAGPYNPGGRFAALDWFDGFFEHTKTVYLPQTQEANGMPMLLYNKPEALQRKILGWYPDGSRGSVVVCWRNSNASHIFNWECEGGKVRFIDAQSGDTMFNDPYRWKNVDGELGILVTRLDNLGVTPEAEHAFGRRIPAA